MKSIDRLRWRAIRVAVAGAAILSLTTAGLAVLTSPAAATPGGTSVSIVSSKCQSRDSNGKPSYAWYGAGQHSPAKEVALKTRVTGKVYACFWKFKFADKDKKFDYWGASVQTYWVTTSKSRYNGYAAQGSHQIASTITARDGVFDGTNSYKSKKSCGTEISLGVQAGIFQASAPVQFCKNYTMQKVRASNTAGFWKIPKVGGVTKVETVYVQKVPQNKKPTFHMTANVPRYSIKWQASLWVPIPNFTSIYQKL